MSRQLSMSAERAGGGPSPAGISTEQLDALLKTAPNELADAVFYDLDSNEPKDEQRRNQFRQVLRDKFELKLSDAVERIWQLPPVILHRSDDEYVRLLVEARDLYIAGHFYSCVAMCGIVGERLIKDRMRQSLSIASEEGPRTPGDEAFDQLERIDVSSMIRFLNKARLLSDEGEKAATKLGQLRNDYAHARGKNPQTDSLKSITELHVVIECTVSVRKRYEEIVARRVRNIE
jgi:hypothetical protein